MERVRIALVSADVPDGPTYFAVAHPVETPPDGDPVEAALRAQHAAWKLRDALSLADWLRFLRGYAVMLNAWDRGRL
ncbi:MAG: hypothetical protein EPO40_19615 [Myxococcaceae bacterium]|nr:MAG: hypothetical protein EPO40_19615 [Myxococcaceae bacterium]